MEHMLSRVPGRVPGGGAVAAGSQITTLAVEVERSLMEANKMKIFPEDVFSTN